MTSSAMASRVLGIGTPSALAVLRLMTSPNFVGCSTGISAGFPPFRILSTSSAARRYKSRRSVPYDMSPPASTNSRESKPCREIGNVPAKIIQWRSFQQRQAGRARLDRGLDNGRELIGRPQLAQLDAQAARERRVLQNGERHGREWRVRFHEHRHSAHVGGQLLQDLQPLAAGLGGLGVKTGDVGAGPIEALDDARSDRIADAGEHDRDGRGRGLRRLGGRRAEPGHDHIGMGCDEFRGKPGQALLVSVGGAKVEDQIPAFVVAELVEPAFHDHRILIAGKGEISHAVALLSLLRAQRQRPKGRGRSHAAQQRQDITSFHSITSPARASSVAGTSIPPRLPRGEPATEDVGRSMGLA
jgi:hypothetical protein